MDLLSTMIRPFLEQLWWIVPLALAAGFLKSPLFKGYWGERAVRKQLDALDPAIYHALHDVTLPTRGGTTQIDHVVVSPHGIFVIETKNMAGWIFGRERDPTWTQNIYGNKQLFQNPLRQNYAHIKALEAALELPPGVFHSVVVFGERATLKGPPLAQVMHPGQLVDHIRSSSGRLLADDQVAGAIDRLESARLTASWATHKAHVRGLRTRKAPVPPSPATDDAPCPRCGNAMARRVRRSDGAPFLGCVRYPACKGIRNFSAAMPQS